MPLPLLKVIKSPTLPWLLTLVAAVQMGCGDKNPTSSPGSGGSGSGGSPSAQAGAAGAAATTLGLHVVDVGSGLGIFAEGPGFALVYDAGSDDDDATAGGNRFVAYLNAVRPDLQRIDHVILSHPHHDHVALLPDVLGKYQIGEVWDSGAISNLCAYREFLVGVKKNAGAYHSTQNDPGSHEIALPQTCTTFPSGETSTPLDASPVVLDHGARIESGLVVALGSRASMEFLHANGEANIPFNRNSLVIRLDVGGKRFLLMGDADALGGTEKRNPSDPPGVGSVEARLLERPQTLDADVLVVGDHGFGDASSSALVSAVSPAISIIPSAPAYGSPAQAVLDELGRYGLVFRTDLGDAACATSAAKIGTPADGKPGGCSNVRVSLGPAAELHAAYYPNLAD